MPDSILRDALARATETMAASVGRGVLAEAGRLLAAHLGPGPYMVVADQNTWAAAGQQVHQLLTEAGCVVDEPLIFTASPYADAQTVGVIEEHLRDAIPVAVGAGTINDLVKMAAFNATRPYACVGTAASMDGYTGSGAPMSFDGVKVTVACRAPAVVLIDLDVVAAAPKHLTASGYGDLAAKIPGGADWIVADVTGVEPIDPEVWRLVQSGVRAALSDPDALAARQPEAFHGLVEGLCLSGLAMQAYGGTRPASGAEHYFSHLWELAGLGTDYDPPLTHGAKVAVGSLAMCAFYEALLAHGLSGIDVDAVAAQRAPWERIEAEIRARFHGALADHAVRETRAKYLAGPDLAGRLRPLVEQWDQVAARLRAQLISTAELTDLLRRADAPSRPEDIGVTRDEVRELFYRAMYYRSRYTVLDAAWELGILDALITDVFDRIWV